MAIAIIFTTRKFISPKNGLSNKNGAKRKVGTVKVNDHRDNGLLGDYSEVYRIIAVLMKLIFIGPCFI